MGVSASQTRRRASGPTGSRGVKALLLLLPMTAMVAACAPAAVPYPPTVSLRMSGQPKNATVTIDDIPVGTLDIVAARGVALPPGRHRITVEAPGYFPSDTLVEALESAASNKTPLVVTVSLLPIPD